MPMIQDYSKYTEEDQEVWSLLFDRQVANLEDKVCGEYLECLQVFSDALNAQSIPDFDELRSVM